MTAARLVLATLAAAALAGCTVPVTGTGAATPGLATTHPCDLLSAEEARDLGVRERGEYLPPKPRQLIPPGCRWELAADGGAMNSLEVLISTTIPLSEFVNRKAPTERFDAGGRTWNLYSAKDSESWTCGVAAIVQGGAFVYINSSSLNDSTQVRPRARAAAEVIAPKLPPPA